MAPAPSPRHSTATAGDDTNPPNHAPAIVGTPPISPSSINHRSGGRSFATGARIARPSVVLCRVKPTIRSVPSAASPSANAAPIASPSPKLCRPMPIAISSARTAPSDRPSWTRLARAARSRCPSTSSPRNAATVAPVNIAVPWNESASAEAPSSPSRVASTSRNASSPMVSAITASRPARSRRASTGYQQRPSNTGSTPTYRPIIAKAARCVAVTRGVSNATAISCSNGVPVDVSSLTRWASPCTHGYGTCTVVRPRCRSVALPSIVNAQEASSTVTCAIVTGSGPSFITDSRMPSWPSVARSMRRRSTAGIPSGRSRHAGFRGTRAAISAASSTSGTIAASQALRVTSRSFRAEHPHPSELGELALMGVEHEPARIAEPRLENRPLPLAQHDGVGRLAPRQRGARAEDVEEHPVQVQAVDQIELGQVDEVDAHQFADPDGNRLVHEMVGHRVDRVDLVVGVEVGVEPVHHHHHLVGGWARRLRIDDEDAVEPLVQMAFQRHGVAVIEVQPERLGVELVDERAAGHHLVLRQRAVHLGRVPAVKVDGVGVRALVDEGHPHAVAFRRAQRGAGHLAVERPRGEEDPGRDLDLAIGRDDAVLAQ